MAALPFCCSWCASNLLSTIAVPAIGDSASQASGFVIRNGTRFELGGEPFRFMGGRALLPSHSICSVVGVPCLCLLHAGGPYTASLSSPKPSKPALAPTLAVAGFNHPQLLQYAASPDPARQRYLTDLLDRAEELGLRVLRTWAHFEGRYGWQDGKQLQVQTRSSCAPLPSRCACMPLAWDACSAAAPGCPAMCLPACWPDTLLLLLNCCQATMCDSRVAAASLAGSACRRSRELITKQHSR